MSDTDNPCRDIIFPSVDKITPEQREVIERLRTNQNDSLRYLTAFFAYRCYCAIHSCGPAKSKPFAIMVPRLGGPWCIPREVAARVANAIGAAHCEDGYEWRVYEIA